jgi:hypothetical protein
MVGFNPLADCAQWLRFNFQLVGLFNKEAKGDKHIATRGSGVGIAVSMFGMGYAYHLAVALSRALAISTLLTRRQLPPG